MKRLEKLLLCITLLTSLLFSNVVYADDTVYTDGALNYIIKDDGTIKITNYFGSENTVKVPMAIGVYFVTEIGDNAFADSNVYYLVLPDTITTISKSAFKNIDDIEITFYDKDNIEVERGVIYIDEIENKTKEDEQVGPNETDTKTDDISDSKSDEINNNDNKKDDKQDNRKDNKKESSGGYYFVGPKENVVEQDIDINEIISQNDVNNTIVNNVPNNNSNDAKQNNFISNIISTITNNQKEDNTVQDNESIGMIVDSSSSIVITPVGYVVIGVVLVVIIVVIVRVINHPKKNKKV